MVSGPLHETTPGRPATAIRIPVILCGAPGVKTKTLSKKKGPGCKHPSRSHGESGEVFLLDILSHRMSVIAVGEWERYYDLSTALPKGEHYTTAAFQEAIPR